MKARTKGFDAADCKCPRLSEFQRFILDEHVYRLGSSFFVCFNAQELFISFRYFLDGENIAFCFFSQERNSTCFALDSFIDIEKFLQTCCILFQKDYNEIDEHDLGENYRVWQVKQKRG